MSTVNFLSDGSPINLDLVLVQKGFDILRYGAFCRVGAGFVEAIHLGKDAVFLDGADHPAFVQSPAIAADKSFLFHGLLLCDAEAHAPKAQPVRGDGVKLLPVEDLPGGNIPGFCAVVYINPNLFSAYAAAEAKLAALCLNKFRVTQPESFAVFPQISQPLEMLQKQGVFLAPGIGTAVKGML